jgi:hypothetical protein
METLYLPIKKMAFHHVTQQPCKKILHFFFSVNFHILVTKKKMKKEKEKRKRKKANVIFIKACAKP